jgi:hypothetical protein
MLTDGQPVHSFFALASNSTNQVLSYHVLPANESLSHCIYDAAKNSDCLGELLLQLEKVSVLGNAIEKIRLLVSCLILEQK